MSIFCIIHLVGFTYIGIHWMESWQTFSYLVATKNGLRFYEEQKK